ncbi:MAG: DNA polymerase-3 subunit gamma/tau, partial [Gammaproteobacteria bacterium]
MSYQVLARKWRPKSFAELVGQQHVLRALTNALDADRLHHAFLFTGTRGVGKTTIARILAKCLNCESGPTATPCGTCSICVEVDEGRYVDLIEVDAASRAKVDETRELLDNVQYAPARGRYKVYLIDEVHMFSKSSFNALLKTLEEPPPHVKFLLATTDPQRLPITVLSRCLQFSLKRLGADLIEGQLARICVAEAVGHDAPSLRLLARAADGSMRDGLSLLDQAIAYGAGALEESDVRVMLGTIERGHLVALLDALTSHDAAALVTAIDALMQSVPDFDAVLGELAVALSRIAVLQAVPNPPQDELDDDIFRDFVSRLTPELVQLYYQIAIIGRRDLSLAPSPRVGFEMALLRMLAFAPDGDGGDLPGATISLPQENASSEPSLKGQAANSAARVTGAAPGPSQIRGSSPGSSPGPSSSSSSSSSSALYSMPVQTMGAATLGSSAAAVARDFEGAALSVPSSFDNSSPIAGYEDYPEVSQHSGAVAVGVLRRQRPG